MSEVISLARQLQGWSQDELADALGIRQQSVSAWETGDSKPSRKNIAQLEMLLPFTEGELALAFVRDDYSRVLARLRSAVAATEEGQQRIETIEEAARAVDRARLQLTEAMEQAERVAQRLAQSESQVAPNDRPQPGA